MIHSSKLLRRRFCRFEDSFFLVDTLVVTSSINSRKQRYFQHETQGRGPEAWTSVSTVGERSASATLLHTDITNRYHATVKKDSAETISTVCQRQAMELSEAFEALGVRVVFYDSQCERWLWADGMRSERFTQLFPTPSIPARASGEDGELLPFNLVPLPAADPPKINGRRSYPKHVHEYRYICLLESLEDGDEYVLIATEVPLTLSQQRSVNQRIHLLHDYLRASRTHSQDNTLELEQRIQKVEHQIRNPLAAIELFADTLILQLPSGELRKQAEAIQATIRDLDERLSLFQRPVHRPSIRKQCDLRSIALDAIAVLQHRWQAKQIFISIPDGLLQVTVNQSQIKQVFENILSNAIYFSPPASVITCEWVVFQQEITVTVSDRGSGLNPEDIKSVFSPHYSRRPDGRGLGLAIAKSFIREHGGDIWCRSLPTGGAQFCFTLSSLATH